MSKPKMIIIGGPNGAGKSTVAPLVLRDTLAVTAFVNADSIATGLSAFAPEGVAIAAGRIMLERIRQLARDKVNFAFETTLASRSFARTIRQCLAEGFEFHAVFLWLENVDLALSRVADRVRQGGHGVPEATVRRRYERSMHNFFSIYLPMATSWRVYDNSTTLKMTLVARGNGDHPVAVFDSATWQTIKEQGRAKRTR